MVYSEEFKEKCKAMYPNSDWLHEALEKGFDEVGHYLCDSSRKGISFEDVLNASTLEKLQEKAKIGVARRKLYSEWVEIWRAYNPCLSEL